MSKEKFDEKIVLLKQYRKKYGNYDEAVKHMLEDGVISDPQEVSGLTLAEVGYVLDITRERVRQIEESAKKKIRKYIYENPELREGMTHFIES